MGDRLLLLSCSQQKKVGADLMPALDRYDAPAFRVLRKFQRESTSNTFPHVYILSARFGLIASDYLIPYYDQQLTKDRAVVLQSQVITTLKSLIVEYPISEMFVHASRDYLQIIRDYQNLLSSEVEMQIAFGLPGQKLAQLWNWLYAVPPDFSLIPKKAKTGKPIFFKGIEIPFSSEQILNIAQDALKNNKGQPDKFFSWYVLIGDTRVSPKWLVSQITKQSVGTFNTNQARNLLTRLGIEVVRT